jgi:hypothetical protein
MLFFLFSAGDQKGQSKDHLNQMVVGAVIDDRGKPVCCEMWPGSTLI